MGQYYVGLDVHSRQSVFVVEGIAPIRRPSYGGEYPPKVRP